MDLTLAEIETRCKELMTMELDSGKTPFFEDPRVFALFRYLIARIQLLEYDAYRDVSTGKMEPENIYIKVEDGKCPYCNRRRK